MQKKFFGRAAVCALLSASFLFAQSSTTTPTAPTPPTAAQIIAARVARLTTLLSLTATQQTQATTIFATAQNTVSGLAASLSAARTALQSAVLANDTNAIAAQAAQIGSLTTQAVTAEAEAEAAFYLILTSDQQTKYKTILAQDPQLLLGGPGGPGGPGGGHPGAH